MLNPWTSWLSLLTEGHRVESVAIWSECSGGGQEVDAERLFGATKKQQKTIDLYYLQ